MLKGSHLALLAMIALLPTWVVAEETTPGKPNVLILLADDFRADMVGRSEGGHPLTPQLDSLGRQGLVLTNAYSPGTTLKTQGVCRRAALFSGRSPLHVKAGQPGDLMTMPAYFGKAGYTTSFVGQRHDQNKPFECGFEKILGLNIEEAGDSELLDGKITDAAIEQLQSHSDRKPWLMCVVFSCASNMSEGVPLAKLNEATTAEMMPVNFAGKAKPAYRLLESEEKPETSVAQVAQIRAGYLRRVHDIDMQVGRILTTLRESGELGNTIVVFTSDNGIELGSHGLMGKDNLYEETVKIPLIIASRDVRPGINHSLVSLVDVLPTLIDMTDGQVPQETDGRSIKPLFSGERPRVRSSIFISHRDSMRSLRDERWKLIIHAPSGGLEFYDLQSDPFEMLDLSSEAGHEQRIRSMLVCMKQWQHAMGDFLDLPRLALLK